MDPRTSDLAVCILAGGEATRLPGKLEGDAGGMPLLARVYSNVAGIAPVTIAAKSTFAPELDAALLCPIVVDRWVKRGPLGGLLSAFGAIRAARVFVVAGDLPRVTAEVFDALARAWNPQTEVAIPVHGERGHSEPLCALYDRVAFLQAAYPIFTGGSGSVRGVVEHLRATPVRFADPGVFANVNTAMDRRELYAR
ncbi:MAG TPA: molybdenum cofactor guanylyltransferase [Candidatus Baltobacteraceae bacterium]